MNTNRENIAEVKEPRFACVLLLDTSASMMGKPIENLNRAVEIFKERTCMDEIARRRMDIAVVEFSDNARIVQEFVPITEFQPVTLSAGGCTAMGNGINLAIDMIKGRIRYYKSIATKFYKPWIFMVTDGMPSDDITFARQRVYEEESEKLKFFAVGVTGADKGILKSITKNYIELNDIEFEDIFRWFSDDCISASKMENPRISISSKNDKTLDEWF